MKDFFISYTKADQPWAEWIAWQLEKEGYTTVIQAWDFHAGSNFVSNMQKAMVETECTVAVISPAFFTSPYTEAEWSSAFTKDPDGTRRKLIMVRVKDVEPPGLLKPRVYIDIVGLDKNDALEKLLKQIKRERAKPDKPPAFPIVKDRSHSQRPTFPGSSKPTTSRDNNNQNSLATWTFGTILFLFFIWVFIFSPDTLPDYKRRLLAFLSAMLAGLLGYFLSGKVNLEISKKSSFGKLAVSAVGGVSLFILVLWWWMSPLAPIHKQIEQSKKPYEQAIAGIVYSESGDLLKGVKISLPEYDETVITNDLGHFKMKVKAEHQASVELVAQKDGYITYEQFATLGNQSIGFTMRENK